MEAFDMSKSNIHVVRHDAGWAPRREGASRVSSVHPTQSQAIASATRTARREGLEVLIHGRDNLIRDRNSYGNDPIRRPG